MRYLTPTRVFVLILLLLALGLWAMTDYYTNLPERERKHETIVLGQSRLVPASQAAMRVVVRDSRDEAPLSGAAIKVSLQSDGGEATLFEGTTDALGTANVSFTVPEDVVDGQQLVVETVSELGRDRVERAVTFERDYRILLTTDKPLYQPGQVIHVRGLALGTFDRVPAIGESLEVVIADGKGNKVFRETVTTSEFGVASVDFQLASEVNTGPYKMTAQLGNTFSEKTVTVERYVLPKFEVDIDTTQSYYLPGETVEGSLNATYFFGKPVADATILVEGFTFDVERQDVLMGDGRTDASGNFDFEFQLPDYIAGSDLDGGSARFYLQVTVTDQTNHSESTSLSLPVTQSRLVIEAIPEGGLIRPGVENILYVLTSYPDGTPAPTRLNLELFDTSQKLQVETGPYGVAEVRFTPNGPWQEIEIMASDAQGNQATEHFTFEGEWQEETVLLRPDRPAYRVGETMKLTILTSQASGTVYLDMIREGQTVNTRAVQVNNGQAEVAVDLTPDLFGTSTVHAYKILRSGTITGDTRLVLVDEANELNLTFANDKEVYRPGETAGLDIQVNAPDGTGAASAIGLAIVDESVFALAEQDPGFAKLYFMLEEQLLQPKYDLHGFTIPDLMTTEPVDDPILLEAQEASAQAALADAAPRGAQFTLVANSHDEAIEQAREQQRTYFRRLSIGMYVLLLLISLVIFGLTIYSVNREKRLARSLGFAVSIIVLLAGVLMLWPMPPWVESPLERLGYVMEWLSYDGMMIGLALLLLGPISFLVLAWDAWRHKRRALRWALAAVPLFIVVLFLTIYAVTQGQIQPDEQFVFVGAIAFFLFPLAFMIRAAAFSLSRHPFLAVATILVAFFTFITPLTLIIGGVSMGMSGAVDEEVFMDAVPAMPVEERALAGAAVGAVEKDGDADEADSNANSAGEPPRLRQYFPETMLWLPDGVTDESGLLHLDVPVADSITTWRLSALASTQDGRLGSATGSLRVFQDFFIDLDLPLALTVGDEIAVPVGIFNYLPDAQTVRLEVEPMEWFELLDETSFDIVIEANEISVVYFRIRALTPPLFPPQHWGGERGGGGGQWGGRRQPFKVTAYGSQMSDAIQKEVRVFPNGKEIRFTQSDRLSADTPARYITTIPAEAIAGTEGLTVKIYPGMISQVVEGLDGMLRMPSGCFEQTSSSTYPNVLVLDYLQSTQQVAPEVQFKAEEYINLGYQRLTTFEVGGGGFSLFGDPPPDRMLTAYGLQQFSDMSQVHNVDPDLVQRAAFWLLSQQQGDGSWENDQGLVHESTWSKLENDQLPVTAYIVWSLAEAGFVNEAGTQQGINYVREWRGQAEDPYVVALVANALVAVDLANGGDLNSSTQSMLDKLAGLAQREGNGAIWPSDVATFMGSEGQTGSIETTALAALAFLRSNSHPDLANAALTSLIQQKDSFGTWYSTQATVLTLKSLIESVRAGSAGTATVTVTLNGDEQRTVQVTPENFDVVQLLTFDNVRRDENEANDTLPLEVTIEVAGEGELMYQVAGNYYLPWEVLPSYPELVEAEEPLTVDVTYDRTELNVDDSVTVNVTLTLNEPGSRVEWGLIDLGIPPGFSVQTEDLSALIERYQETTEEGMATIERYELTGRQILIYTSNLSDEQPLSFSYRLKAKYPLTAQTPASNAYDYYNPDVNGQKEPQVLVVR